MDEEAISNKPPVNYPKKRMITPDEVKSIINEEYASVNVSDFPDNTYIVGQVIDAVYFGEYTKSINNEEIKTQFSRVNIKYHPRGYDLMNIGVRVSVAASQRMIDKHGSNYIGRTARISKSCVVIEGKARYPQSFGIIADRPEPTPLFVKHEPNQQDMFPLQPLILSDKEKFLMGKLLGNARAEDLSVDKNLFFRTIVRHLPETEASRIPKLYNIFTKRFKDGSRQ